MPKFLSPILNSPAVRKAFWLLVAAVLSVLGYSQLPGCTPAQLERADAARSEVEAHAAKAACVDAALRKYDVLTHPEHTTVEDAASLAQELKACLKPAPAADAGA